MVQVKNFRVIIRLVLFKSFYSRIIIIKSGHVRIRVSNIGLIGFKFDIRSGHIGSSYIFFNFF